MMSPTFLQLFLLVLVVGFALPSGHGKHRSSYGSNPYSLWPSRNGEDSDDSDSDSDSDDSDDDDDSDCGEMMERAVGQYNDMKNMYYSLLRDNFLMKGEIEYLVNYMINHTSTSPFIKRLVESAHQRSVKVNHQLDLPSRNCEIQAVLRNNETEKGGTPDTTYTTARLEDVPAGIQHSFKSVEEVVASVVNKDSSFRLPDTVIYKNLSLLLEDPQLGDIVRDLLPNNPTGSWRTMQFVNGCCPLLKFYAANNTMNNINGVQRRIVHFTNLNPPKYQFIQHGICTPTANSDNQGRHRGCVQGDLSVPLLIWDTGLTPPFTFDFFRVPSHCMCYNN